MRQSIFLLLILGCAISGCGLATPIQRFRPGNEVLPGLVVLIPGVEGEGIVSNNVRTGLAQGGVSFEVVTYQWGWQVPLLGMAMNQGDLWSHMLVTRELARQISSYRKKFPEAPVFILGHSAGGGLAVLVAEELAKQDPPVQVEGLILLAPSISADYPVGTTMRGSRRGVVNFFNVDDQTLLAGTAILGNVDGKHGPAAGQAGFDAAKRGPWVQSLYQVQVRQSMLPVDELPHLAITNPPFVARYVAPWITSSAWPVAD